MEQKELQDILSGHAEWLLGNSKGKRANLSSANLSSVDLSFADLRSANLSSADLSSIDLRSANLSFADLRSANLSFADLRSANLRSANLRSADLRSAKLYNTIGDGEVIRSMQLGYIVSICDDWLQIGCKGYRLHEWANFTNEQIQRMDNKALEWWKNNQALIVAFCDANYA